MTRKLQLQLVLLSILLTGELQAQAQFDGDRAMDYLVAQCDFGPRVPNTPAARQAIAYFTKFFNSTSDTVVLQQFDEPDPYSDQILHLTNVIGRFAPRKTTRVLLGAHWDSRPRADQDTYDPTTPIIGANDGASGVAVLMEIANQLHLKPSEVGVDLVLFDGEDWGKEGDLNEYLLGSRYYAKNPELPRARWVVILDMIGDADLEIPIEPYSHKAAPEVVRQLWDIARELKFYQFIPRMGYPVYDDHIPFIERDYEAVDLIDFQYPNADENYWHTHEDTPDKCSAESLEAVGKTLLTWVYRQ